MKLTLKQLKKIIKEEVTRTMSSPSLESIKREWLELSGGLPPDAVEPEEHEDILQQVADHLNCDIEDIRELVQEWGEGESLMGLTNPVKR